MATNKPYDVAVIGAGVFGAWTAYLLRRAGRRVALAEAYGPAHARASSGGESRLIRMGYGPDELFTRWSVRSLEMWIEFFESARQPLFFPTGILWINNEGDAYANATKETLSRVGVPHEILTRVELEYRWPQIAFGRASWGLFEPNSGVLLARRAVATVVQAALQEGVDYFAEQVLSPEGARKADNVRTTTGEVIRAGEFVFCCGPWLGKVFPNLLGSRMFVTRQEVFFFGVPAANRQFAPPAMPGWLYVADLFYGMPDLESRGFKIAHDQHGERFDPGAGSRVPTPQGLDAARAYLAEHFPALADAPMVEARVCQYENTSNGDFLVDRHPDFDNVWIAGGGSGHGFKHGPAMGEYVVGRLAGTVVPEPRFALDSKASAQKRTIF
ncbi:MAG TPA: FAD-dependent oxidoreductase [Candidatus Acidoferrales bacterium]|nr:FAD-dependent oxidoreductase [Candidatus Acidoferrales bacterium]